MIPELGSATDQLWKFNLQRKHARLLKDMDNHREAFTAFAEEAKVAQEQLRYELTGLKSKVELLADENKKQTLEVKDFQRAINQKSTEIDKIKANLAALGVHVDSLSHSQHTLKRQHHNLLTSPLLHKPALTSVLPALAMPTTPTPVPAPRPRPTATSPPAPAPNIANTGFRKTRSSSRRRRQAGQGREPSPPHAQPTSGNVPDPPLRQGKLSFAEYFVAMQNVSLGVDPVEHARLIGMFVAGLASRERREEIVGGLEERGMCGVQSDGGVEWKMEGGVTWEGFKSLLGAVGLLAGMEMEMVVEEGKGGVWRLVRGVTRS